MVTFSDFFSVLIMSFETLHHRKASRKASSGKPVSFNFRHSRDIFDFPSHIALSPSAAAPSTQLTFYCICNSKFLFRVTPQTRSVAVCSRFSFCFFYIKAENFTRDKIEKLIFLF